MRVLDLPIIEQTDRLVSALHHVGIQRTWVLRASGVGVLVDCIMSQPERPLWSQALGGLLIVLVIGIEEGSVRSLGSTRYNARQLWARLHSVLYVFRLSFVSACLVTTAASLLQGSLLPALGDFGWVLWWYLSLTFLPPDPPKRALRDLFRPSPKLARASL